MSQAGRTPEAIAAEIATTRERLVDTIDQLVYRAQPKTIASRQLDAMRQSFYTDSGSIDAAKIGKLAGGVLGFVALVIVIRRIVG